MIRNASLAQIPSPLLKKAAERLDVASGVGNADGVISTAEVDKAIAAAEADPAKFGDVAALKSLRTFLVHCGETTGASSGPATLSGGGYNPLALRAASMTGTAQAAKEPVMLQDPKAPDSCTKLFEVPYGQRNLEDRQSMLVPLDGRELHLIELKYQDTRKLKDLEFNYREKGSYQWKTARGDQWFDLEKAEKRGELEIKRESDHNSPWINNPIRVKVEVLYPDGRIHDIGKKFLDFHVHDAHSPDSSGYPETDNISNGYERLPAGKLPEGCLLRLTPMHENRKPWEQDRTVAAEVSWIKPIYKPDHKEAVRVHSAYGWEKPRPEGYAVDPDRKIAAVMVTWTDHGGMASGSVSMKGDSGTWRSPSYNIGSGETELIPVDGYARDGKLFVQGHGMELKNIEVLYAE